jgi:AcrR family transcriptional regulator
MSPAPARTTDAAIVAAARDLLEAGGPDAITMQAVAARVGIRAPSLYKHVASRSALLRVVAEDAMAEIGAEIASAARTGDATADVRSMAFAFRAWAHGAPNAYRNLFGPFPGDDRPSTGLGAAAVAPLLDACTRLVGPARALDAARLLTAYVHGFTNMELAGGFGLGGDIDDAFRWGIETLTRALRDGEAIARPAAADRARTGAT